MSILTGFLPIAVSMIVMMISSRVAAGFATLVLAAVLASCGSTDPTTTTTTPADPPTTSAADVETTTSAADDEDDTPGGAPSSLEEYLGTAALVVRSGGGARPAGVGLGAGFDVEAIAEEQQLIEIEVQKCMQAQGFEYVPEPVAGGLRLFAAADNQGLSAADYAATEGFGISTLFDAVFAGDIDLVDDEASPNDEHLATLSEGEADAWNFALRGEAPVRDGQGRLVDPDTGEPITAAQATGGCRAEAQLIVRGDLSSLGELADAWDLLEDRIEADPRIAEIRRDWAACMLERGFDYTDVDEARQDIESRLRPLMVSFAQQAGFGPGQGDATTRPGGARGGAGAVIDAIAEAGLSDEQAAELQALQDLEIATAVASLECSGDSAAEIAEIEARYEAEFIDQNRALLEAFAS